MSKQIHTLQNIICVCDTCLSLLPRVYLSLAGKRLSCKLQLCCMDVHTSLYTLMHARFGRKGAHTRTVCRAVMAGSKLGKQGYITWWGCLLCYDEMEALEIMATHIPQFLLFFRMSMLAVATLQPQNAGGQHDIASRLLGYRIT